VGKVDEGQIGRIPFGQIGRKIWLSRQKSASIHPKKSPPKSMIHILIFFEAQTRCLERQDGRKNVEKRQFTGRLPCHPWAFQKNNM
jgi:hypothetical protein